MKRLVVMMLLCALVMGLVVLPAAAAKKVTVTFWHAMKSTSSHGKTLAELTQKFNESQDRIEVVLVYQGGYGDLSKKILGSVAAGKPPVMAQVYEDWTTKLVKAGAVEPVEKYMGDVFSKQEIADINAGFRASNTWNNTMYTMPFNKSTNLLYVNLDYVKEIPTTWDELIVASKAATKDTDGDGTIDIYGFGIRPNVDAFNVFMRQAGGNFLNEDQTEAVFNNEAGQEALQFMHDLVYKHKCAIIYTGYLNQLLGEGKVAMYEDSSAGMPYAAKAVGDKYEWTVAPLVKGKLAAAPFMGTNVAVFSKHKDKYKTAAMEFIRFLTNTENTTLWATKTGYLPIRYSALETSEWKAFEAQDEKNAAGPTQLAYGTFDPCPDGWSAMRKIISNYIEAALLDKMTVKDALDKAVKEVNGLLAKNQ